MFRKLLRLFHQDPEGDESFPEELLVAVAMAPRDRLQTIAPYLMHSRKTVRNEANALFEAALVAAGDFSFSSIDLSLKQVFGPGFKAPWQFKPADLQNLGGLENRNLLRVATCFWNGYVRQAALKLLCQEPQPLDWPFILERVNDWVPSIRSIAWDAVVVGLKAGKVEEITYWQKALAGLCGKTRVNTSPLMQEIVLFSVRGPFQATSWNRASLAFRRLAATVILANPEHAKGALPALYKDHNVLVLRLLTESFVEHPEYVQPELCLLLTRSQNPVVREIALNAVVRFNIGQVQDSLETALRDPVLRVRSMAQFWARKRQMDLRSFYLEHIATNPSPGVIEGLGEAGEPSHSSVIQPFLSSSLASMRLAAAGALLRLGSIDSLASMLRDPSAKVRRVAIDYAKQHYEAFDTDARLELFQSEDRGASLAGAELLMSLSKWHSLPWILKILGHEDAQFKRKAQAELHAWLRWAHRSPGNPSAEAIEEALDAFELAKPHLSDEDLGDLEQFLGWAASRVSGAR